MTATADYCKSPNCHKNVGKQLSYFFQISYESNRQ